MLTKSSKPAAKTQMSKTRLPTVLVVGSLLALQLQEGSFSACHDGLTKRLSSNHASEVFTLPFFMCDVAALDLLEEVSTA